MSSAWPPSEDLRLVGEFITLSAYRSTDAAELTDALSEDIVWEYSPQRPTDPSQWDSYAAKGQSRGRWMWVARLTSARRGLTGGSVVGCSSYYDVSLDDAHLTIGYTVFRREVWRDVANPETKLLMLKYAFDDRKMARVEFRVDDHNEQSKAAMLGIGATREGVLRDHMRRRDKTLRDTVVFSILSNEWPTVREILQERIRRRVHDA